MFFKIDRKAFESEFNSPSGMVGRHLIKQAKLLQRLARAQVGMKTGKLRKSINYTINKRSTGLVATIGSNNKIAFWHHEGTKPHIITPKSAKTLRFNSRGKIVYAKVVRHPGTKPNKYLTDNLRKII